MIINKGENSMKAMIEYSVEKRYEGGYDVKEYSPEHEAINVFSTPNKLKAQGVQEYLSKNLTK